MSRDKKGVKTVKQHFENKPKSILLIYEKLLRELRKFGEVKESPNNSSIHLVNKYGFAGVYTRGKYILLHIHLSKQLDSVRFEKIEQISKNRFKHVVKLNSLSDIDKELLNWLKQAYELKG